MMKTAGLAFALPMVLGFQQMENPYIESREVDVQDLSIIDSIGTAPCVFKLGDSFYDFTPFKIAYPNPKVSYIDGTPIPTTNVAQYEFVFGWCQ